MRDLDLTASVIDIRDVIERFETLETTRDEIESEWEENEDNAGLDFANYVRTDVRWGDDEEDEFQTLHSLLDELAGCGGDEEWRGDWYPITLINDDYFVEYAEELVKDCGYIPHNLPSWIAIDWEKTADAVKEDYSWVNVGAEQYWYR